jgi:hypothetical protein
MPDIVIKDGRFWRRRADGGLVQIVAPKSRGLASPTFATTGANRRQKGSRS